MQETAERWIQERATPATAVVALVACGLDGPRFVPLPEGGELIVGRHESCQLSLRDPALSRYHARFSHRAGSVTVEDLGSRHGTWLAGQRVDKAQLDVGASVRLADVVVAVTLATHADVPPDAGALASGAVYLSPRMQEVRRLLHKLAHVKVPVVILGETGTGKELAARELHLASPRRQGPLRVLNCAAVPSQLIESTLFGHERGAFTGAERARAGVFEDAHGGTLFLDEVGELSLAAQAALLRVLETSRLTRVGSNREIGVDVRIVSATHRDLHEMALRGEFRHDLLHRLCVLSVELPPLRERREEVLPLVKHFLAQSGNNAEIDPGALSLLEAYVWPGNVRELRNVIARAAVLRQGPSITVQELPESLRVPAPALAAVSATSSSESSPATASELRGRLKSIEYEALRRALLQTGGNQRQAAELLGLPLRTFERRLQAMRRESCAGSQTAGALVDQS